MHSPMEGVVTPMTVHGDGSSTEESLSSRDSTPVPGGLPDDHSRFDDRTHTTAVGDDAPVQGIPSMDPIDPIEEKTVIHARAYQVEMFEKSLEENIIVAMDTGSGKTQVAVLRIQAELEKRSDKIIWFLAPTVALCEQQFRVLRSQIGPAQIKLLTGTDNVDSWSDNRIWDEYLKNVRVVVSSYQVLLDAITHAFVKLDRLCLIIFDEAHNCVKNHPGSRIMKRYRAHKNDGMPCPAILGLTASPIMRSRIEGIETIEQTLDAICRSPTTHKEEFLSIVKRPTLFSITIPISGNRLPTSSLASLARVCQSIDIYQDPYILRLRREGTEKSLYKLRKTLEKRDTYAIKQMESFYHKCTELHKELGPWASEYFAHKAVTHFLESSGRDLVWFETWDVAEKQHLATILRQAEIDPPQPFNESSALRLSRKFTALVHELRSAPNDTRCIIFVTETVTVAVLSYMLSATTSINNRYRIGSMVGASNHAARKQDIGDFMQPKGGQDLEDFRTGKLNLLVATSVAEEGIDVPACNLVISFNSPQNLKSFIQRRGRARMENSRIIQFLEGSPGQYDQWMELEAMMKRCYEDDTRIARELTQLEELDADSPLSPLHIPSTGAQLDFDQARSHLEHFCQKTTHKQYIDHRPFYISEQVGTSPDGLPRLRAVVHLPPSLPQAIRRVESRRQWYSERNAFKDAAFQAFKAVYKAGLVNDNLMPLIDDISGGIETRSSMMTVSDVWKPWQKIAQLWRQSDTRMQREILLKDGDRVMARFDATLPCAFPKVPPFKAYWDENSTWTVEISERSQHVTAQALKGDQSAALIHLSSGHRWRVEDTAHILHLQSTEDIAFGQHVGQRAVDTCVLDPEYAVRNQYGRPYSFIEWLPSKPSPDHVQRIETAARDGPEDVPWLALKPWPRRVDFLHPVQISQKSDRKYPRALPASYCTLDTIDRSKAYFGSVIPSIIHMLEIYLTAEELCHTVLEAVEFSDISLVVTAISSRSAGEATDYERLEFLGDSVLKLLATLSVMIQKPHYPEGYLSALKDRIVANSRLCRASVDAGLDRFILTRIFTSLKWRPVYIKDHLSDGISLDKRELSTKTLADAVESLIGAAFIDGGMPRALTCLHTLLPEVEWHDLTDARAILFNRKDIVTQLCYDYEPLEELVGYEFQNKALLMEALTHGSFSLGTSTEVCMERLEFLGDSILDSVIVSILWEQEPELTNYEMHLLRVACVNADILGFLVMEWCVFQETTKILPRDLTTDTVRDPVPFWKYMRYGSPDITQAQQAVDKCHKAERELILDAIANSTEYPWAQLSHLNIPKFFSDMFESLIGAVWVDSGSMEACKQVVERVGILPYLRRIISEKIDVRHPKAKLGELVGQDGMTVRYEAEVRQEGGVKDLFCKVFVDEEFIVEVDRGVNPQEVVTKAARQAYYKLLGQANGMEDEIMT
ncbi:RNase3 domain-containing protein [Xylaria palmicola]|nr:RNase3 domain-containing protein [Xylaria palmicola]